MNKKKKKNYFLRIIIIFFFFFLIIYLSKESGYYEYQLYNKTKLTQQAILQFENDVNLGRDVTINDYVINEYIDYSNDITDASTKIGNLIENLMNKGLKKSFGILKKLFYE